MKKKMIALFALLAAVALTGFSVSGTYAKYVSTISGTTDAARVAKWAFEVNEKPATESFEFKLFDTIKDTENGEESDVKTGEKIIAPGTEGSFTIKLENKSEVNANVKAHYTVTNSSEIPIEFSTDNSKWTKDLSDLAEEKIEMETGSKEITIYWRWLFDAEGERQTTWEGKDDAADTTLGQAGEATVTVKADITVTQID